MEARDLTPLLSIYNFSFSGFAGINFVVSEDTQLHLFDLVTTQICPLKYILSKIPQPIEEVVIYFSPELLDVKNVQAFVHAFDETVLMVRGNFAAEGEKFMLPRSARC